MIRSPFPRRIAPPLALLAALISAVASAADIYVVEARIERDGVSALAPTFIVTRGDRALLAFEGERELDVAMTILPPSGDGTPEAGKLELRVELVDADSRHDEIVDVSLYRPTTVRLGERELEISVREQEGASD